MDTRKKAVRRLKIIKGQVEGLITMIETEEDCEKIFPQIKAVKSAFNGFSAEVMKSLITECLVNMQQGGHTKKQEKLEKMIEKFSGL